MQTRDQKRAASAYEKVSAVNAEVPEFKVKYGGICLKMPAMIQQNGLCQAFSFYETKSVGDTQEAKVRSLYLRDLTRLALADDKALPSTLSERVRKDEVDAYLTLSREVVQCAVWLKRYAEAVLKVKPGVEVDDVGGNK